MKIPFINIQKVTKSNQEQAIASWTNYCNQIRLDRMFEGLNRQDVNLSSALETLKNTSKVIDSEIILRNRGGDCGMHGFIAEVAECGVGNAREQIVGKSPTYIWINDNGPVDIIKNGVDIQQKFVNSGNHLSLRAIQQHLEAYPDFLKNGGKYQIPRDHFEKIKYLLSISKDEANKMPTSTGDFSLSQWKEVHEFYDGGHFDINDIEPSNLSYDQVQRGAVQNTLQNEEKSITETNEKIREEIFNENKPSVSEGLKIAGVSAAIEGGTTFLMAIVQKRKEGKKIGEFNQEDWNWVLKETGIGTLKGGIRGITIYALTNYTATSAFVANAFCTASFGVAEQVHLMKIGCISEEQFLENSEIICLDATVSALSSYIGQMVIPIPILGAIIGNTVGMVMYGIAKDYLSDKEQRMVEEYLEYLDTLNAELDQKYQLFIKNLNDSIMIYRELMDKAFSPNAEYALQGSVSLAMFLGVSSDSLLKNLSEIDQFFLGE